MKKGLLFCSLLAMSLVVLLKESNADYNLPATDVDTNLGYGASNPDPGNTNGKYAGIQLWQDSVTPKFQWWNTVGSTWTDISGSGNVYNIFRDSAASAISNTITITGVNTTDGSVSAILTNDGEGTFNLGHINITGETATENHTLYGFLYLDDAGFNGTINGGDVTVHTTNGSEIVGVYFRQLSGTSSTASGNKQMIDTGARITFNDIKVTAGTTTTPAVDGAAGFAAGAVANGAGITLRSVEAEGAWATGLEFAGLFQGTLEVKGIGIGAGEVKATATENEARGLLLIGGTDTGATINITNITATADNTKDYGNAFGIEVGHFDPTAPADNTISDIKNTEIKVATISVSGTQASGIFVTGDIDNSTINIGSNSSAGSITAAASSGYAVGIDVDGDIKTSAVTVTGTMNATSDTGTAHAIDVTGTVDGSNLKITGAITAETGGTVGTSASGISVGGIDNHGEITAEGTITATATGSDGTAVGIGVVNDIKGNGKIAANAITATASSGEAAGIVVKNTSNAASGIASGSSIESGTITVNALGKAAGMELNGNVDGEIRVNGSVSATSTRTSALGYPADPANEQQNAYGIVTRGTLGKTTVTGAVTANSTSGNAFGIGAMGQITDDVAVAGTITANGGFNAAGFASLTGGLDEGKKVTIQAINVTAGKAPTKDDPTSTGNEAAGVRFTGDVAGTLQVTNINVASHGNGEDNNGYAFGVHVAQGGLSNQNTGSNERNQFGNITVTSNNPMGKDGTEPTAAGIWTAGDSYFTLSGDIKVESAGYSVNNGTLDKTNSGTNTANYGIFVENGKAEISLVDFCDISILASGAAKNVDVKVQGDLTVKGSNATDTAAHLGVIEVDGNFMIDGGESNSFYRTSTITLDIAKSNLNGTNSITSAAKLNVYGDGKAAGYNNGDTAATFEGLTDDKFYNFDKVHIWSLSNENIIYGGIRDIIYMSDGRLAALTMHNRYAAWNSVRDRMISGDDRCRRGKEWHGYRGQSCDPCDTVPNYDPNPCDPRALYSVNGGDAQAWVNYTGRSDAYWSPYHEQNWKLSMEGMQIGTDVWRTRWEQLGILFGYEEGRMRNNDDQIKVKDPYFGVYGARIFSNGADIRGVFAYGWQKYNMLRVDQGAGDYPEGYWTRFSGHTTESHVELGKRMSAGPWSLRPVFGVDMLTNDLGRGPEWDWGSDIFYNKTHLTQVFLRAGTDLRFKSGFFTFNSGVYYSYDVHERAGKNLRTTATTVVPNINGEDEYLTLPLVGSKLGRSLLTFNAGGECLLTDWFSIIGGYNGEYAFDRSHGVVQHSGYIGGAWQW